MVFQNLSLFHSLIFGGKNVNYPHTINKNGRTSMMKQLVELQPKQLWCMICLTRVTNVTCSRHVQLQLVHSEYVSTDQWPWWLVCYTFMCPLSLSVPAWLWHIFYLRGETLFLTNDKMSKISTSQLIFLLSNGVICCNFRQFYDSFLYLSCLFFTLCL